MIHTEIVVFIPVFMVPCRTGRRKLLQECLTFGLHFDTITTRLNDKQYRKHPLSDGLP